MVIFVFFVQIFFGIIEDWLVGVVDVVVFLFSGSVVFQFGLLVDVYCGVFYVDEFNFFDDGIVNLMLVVVGSGENCVEWEGFSFSYFCWFLLIVIYNLEEGNVCDYLLDCFVIVFFVNQLVSIEQWVEIINVVISYGQCSCSFVEKWSEEIDVLVIQLLLVCQWLLDVQISGE